MENTLNNVRPSGNDRVVITGTGVVSALGHDTQTLWQNLLAGNTRVEAVPEHWSLYWDVKSKVWSPLSLPDYKALGLNRTDLHQFDPVTLNAIVAGFEALCQAQLLSATEAEPLRGVAPLHNIESARCGVFVGSGVGGISSFVSNYMQHIFAPLVERSAELDGLALSPALQGYLQQYQAIERKFNPFAVPRHMSNAAAAGVGIKYNLTGAARNSSHACASGTMAVGEGFEAIKRGVVDMALCGGSEYLEDQFGAMFRGFDVARTLTTYDGPITQSARPFDRNRSGFLYSQGAAGMLVLESLTSAQRRGAPILAEVVAYRESFDAKSIMGVDPAATATKRMLHELLADARCDASDIHYFNTHGTGTQANDEVESQLIEELFGQHIYVNSTKSILGHTIAASGAIEAIVTALSLQQQMLHPSLNLQEPVRDLNFVTQATAAPIEIAISQSLAFGGHNAGLLLQRFNG